MYLLQLAVSVLPAGPASTGAAPDLAVRTRDVKALVREALGLEPSDETTSYITASGPVMPCKS